MCLLITLISFSDYFCLALAQQGSELCIKVLSTRRRARQPHKVSCFLDLEAQDLIFSCLTSCSFTSATGLASANLPFCNLAATSPETPKSSRAWPARYLPHRRVGMRRSAREHHFRVVTTKGWPRCNLPIMTWISSRLRPRVCNKVCQHKHEILLRR